MLVHIALTIASYLHVDSCSTITVKIVGVESVIAGYLISTRESTEVHSYDDVHSWSREMSFGVVSIVVRIDLEIDDFVTLLPDVLDFLATLLDPLINHG